MYKKSTPERVLIDEAYLNGRRVNPKIALPILEVEGKESYLDKARRDPDLPIYLVGIIQSGDKPNRNGRIYPWPTLKKECIRYMEEEVPHSSFGELDHPENGTIPLLSRASHTIEDMWFKNKDVWAKIKILNAYAPAGDPSLKARSLILNGKKVGISSRALGSIVEDSQYPGYDMVDEDLEMICWDLVSKASNYGSENLDLTESKKRKGLLTESRCLGSNCNIIPIQERRGIVKNLKLSELTEAEKVYLNILGIEKFLQYKRKN
jgi:hypothetical protein